MALLKRGAVLLAVSAVGLGALTGVAQASDATVKAAIHKQDRSLAESAAVKKILKSPTRTTTSAPKAIKLFTALEKRFDAAATAVSKTSASTAKGRTGEADWVGGVRGVAKGLGQFVVAFKDVEHKRQTAAKKEATTAVKTIAAAEKRVATADKDLGLPAGD